jgi:hypothetical protein
VTQACTAAAVAARRALYPLNSRVVPPAAAAAAGQTDTAGSEASVLDRSRSSSFSMNQLVRLR